MPFDSTGFPPAPPRPAPPQPGPGGPAVSVLIIVLSVMLLAVPVSLPALVDIVHYLQGR